MRTFYYTLGVFAILFLVTISSCDDSDETPDIATQQLSNLAGTWQTTDDSNVTANGQNAAGDWSNFQITFSENGSVESSGVPEDASIFDISSFSIEGSNVNSFTVVFNGITQESASAFINGDNLTLSFVLSSDTDQLGQRTSGISGEWVFNLTRQ